jgi:hypothetical protein
VLRPALVTDALAESRRRIATGTRRRGVEAWRLRRNVLRRDLRSAVKQLAAVAKLRVARARPQPRRNAFRPLSESEAAAFLRSASVTRHGLNDANQRQQMLHYRLAHKS